MSCGRLTGVRTATSAACRSWRCPFLPWYEIDTQMTIWAVSAEQIGEVRSVEIPRFAVDPRKLASVGRQP